LQKTLLSLTYYQKNMKKYIPILIIFIVIDANIISQTKNVDYSLTKTSMVKIEKKIVTKYKNVSDIKIERIYLENFNTYSSDPGYIEGDKIRVDNYCLKLSFSTTTYNDNGTIKYIDGYQFIVPEKKVNVLLNKEACFCKNNYHGKGYHGGSARIQEMGKWLLDIIQIVKQNRLIENPRVSSK